MVLAALGEREPPGELTPEEKKQARRQARGVWLRAILAGIAATVLVWVLSLFNRVW